MLTPSSAFEHVSGETFKRSWILESSSGAVDLTGATATFYVRDWFRTLKITASTNTGQITLKPGGVIELQIAGADFNLPIGAYRWQLEVSFPGGERRIIDRGTVTILRDVANG